MKKDDPKYLTLTGYPLHVPLWKTFHQTAGVQAGMLFSALAAVTDMAVNRGANMVELLPMAFLVPAVNGFHKVMEAAIIDEEFETNLLRLPFKGPGKKLAIDTRPPAYLETSASLLSSAKDARKKALIATAAMGGVSAIAISVIINVMPEADSALILASSAIGTILASAGGTFGACAHRFNKVVKGDYVIVDAPPKEKREERLEASGLAPSL